jgi:hypothetical protein
LIPFDFLLEKESKVKTKIIQADFSGGHEIYEPIGKELEGLKIGVLGLFTIQSSVSVNENKITIEL